MSVPPLTGKRVVVTRSEEQADTFARALEEQGATPILFPTIQVTTLSGPALAAALENLAGYAWIIFTSANAVRTFFQLANERSGAAVAPRLPRVAATGRKTAALLTEYGVTVDFVPDSFTGAAVAVGLPVQPGDRVLLPRSRKGLAAIVQGLTDRGVQVDDIAIYDTVLAEPPPDAFAALTAGIDFLTFTSPSTARNFYALVPREQVRGAVVACIGPTTADAVAALGVDVAIVPETYTLDGLLAALIDYCRDAGVADCTSGRTEE